MSYTSYISKLADSDWLCNGALHVAHLKRRLIKNLQPLCRLMGIELMWPIATRMQDVVDVLY
jgi:hypothetical protein